MRAMTNLPPGPANDLIRQAVLIVDTAAHIGKSSRSCQALCRQ
jgi:hypothetical protein